jgi:Family of unknown function (DUF6886)
MGWSVEPVRPPVVLHYSEDPAIERFVPHVPVTNPAAGAHVWGIEPAYAPLYWFPRDCARVTVWAHDDEQRARLHRTWACAGRRLHFVGAGTEAAMRSTELFEYAFAPEPFVPWADAEGQWVADVEMRPRAVRPMGDLVAAHEDAGVELRFDTDLSARRDEVVASGLPFSIVRWSTRV